MLDIPIEPFNAVIGYSEKYNFPGFRVLDEAQSRAALAEFDLEALPGILENEPLESSPTLDDRRFDASLDIPVEAFRRREQRWLRLKLLQGRESAPCDLCGREFPADLLVAAHIKRRSLASNEERLVFPYIGMLACKFGCDDLYEKGHLAVDSRGYLQTVPYTGEGAKWVNNYLAQLEGAKAACDIGEERAKYFQWHFVNVYEKKRANG